MDGCFKLRKGWAMVTYPIFCINNDDENIESENAPPRCLDQLNGGLTPLADFIDRSPLCIHPVGRSAQVDIVFLKATL